MAAPDRRVEINIRLCRYFGLDADRVSAFSLHVSAADLPYLVVTQFVPNSEDAIEEEYELTEVRSVDFMVRLTADLERRAQAAHEQIKRAFAKSRQALLNPDLAGHQGGRHA